MLDAIIKLLDSIFRDGATGSLLLSRAVIATIMLMIGFLWYKGTDIMEIYKESKYSQYSDILEKEKQTRFISVYQEQIQYVYSASGSDLTALYTFRPTNLNYFVDMISYQGKLPDIVDPKNLGGFPIDKTSKEYQLGTSGGTYSGNAEISFLPSKLKHSEQISFIYSCPYFNLANVYSGAIEMYWYSGKKPDIPDFRLSGICNQAARAIGRAE